MELIRICTCIILLIFGSQYALKAQDFTKNETRYKWGVELEPSALLDRYGALKGGVWISTNTRERIGLDVGYGWDDMAPKKFISQEIFTEKFSTLLIQAQFIHIWNSDPRIVEFYYAIGPYFQTAKGSLSSSFFYDRKNEILTTHEGAVYNNDRLGLTGDIGVRFNLDIFTMDLRLGATGFNNSGKFNDVIDPFEIKNFVPSEIKFYQSAGQTIGVRPQAKFRFGFRF